MSRRYSWIALGLGAYLAFALALFPASVAYRWFAPETIRLTGIQGTIWSGSAALGSVSAVGFHDLEWRLRSWETLLLRAGGQVQARLADGFLTTGVRANASQATLSDLQATTSLAGLRDLLPLGDVEGLVSAQFATLRFEDEWPVEAEGEIRIGDLAVPPLLAPGNPLIELGSYRVRFDAAQAGQLIGVLEDQGGPLEVSGTITLSPDRAYSIAGAVRERPSAPAELVQGLELATSPPDSSGMRAFDFNGSL